jgi:molecular chaperone GrpE
MSSDAPSTDSNNGTSETQAQDVIAESMEHRLMRWQAEFQNLQRRTVKDIEAAQARTEIEFASELLPTLDTLERAIAVATETTDKEAVILKGIQLAHAELKRMLAGRGIGAFESDGQPFDPHKHEAVMRVESNAPAMTVVTTYQCGYFIRDRILRPAKVSVSSGKPE